MHWTRERRTTPRARSVCRKAPRHARHDSPQPTSVRWPIGIPLHLRTRRAAAPVSLVSAHFRTYQKPIVSLPTPERPRVPTITVGLRPHPASPPFQAATDSTPAIVSPVGMLLATMYAAPDGSAVFEFRLEDSPLGKLRIPAPTEPGPADALWKHTCFEVFIGVKGEPAYREFNFSPSGQWAIYDFRAWRERNDDFRVVAAPQLRFEQDGKDAWLEARVPGTALPTVPAGTELEIGLAAVIERDDGELEYWAVQHSVAQPDFHARNTFVLMLKTWVEPSDKS